MPPAPLIALERAARRLGVDGRAIEALAGGTRNHVYRLGVPPRSVVVRIAGAGDADLAVDRESEVAAQRAAAARGLAPRLLWSSLAEGIVASEWLPGRSWSREEAGTPQAIERVAAWLRALHATPPPAGLRRVDYLETLLFYCGRLEAARVPRGLLEAAQDWRAALGEPPRLALCHHDLHHSNVVDSGAEIRWVDWEYAGLGDPLMDLAGYVSYQQLDEDQAAELLAAYGQNGAITPERLRPARQLFEAVATVWAEVFSSCGAIKKQS